KDLYANYEELSAIYIVLNQLPEYYESSRENKGGEIKKGTPKLLDAFYIKLPITQGGAESGSIFIGFQKKELDMILENLTSFNGLSLYMISGTTNRLYTFHDNKIAKETFERQEMIITESLKKNSQLPIDDLEKNNFVQHQELSDD
ncbi:sensor histidine kinase, partial [Enterococcus faecium]